MVYKENERKTEKKKRKTMGEQSNGRGRKENA